MNDFFVALGANLPSSEGSPSETLRAALETLRSSEIAVQGVSRFYQTPCFPAGTGPDYVNAAAHLRSDLGPQAMLDRLHSVEAQFGRERVERWGMRTLDLDLLTCGNRIEPDLQTYESWRRLPAEEQRKAAPGQLILPHPRLQDRAFVLVPLRDIAADWCHPVLNLTVNEMCDALPSETLAEISPL